MLIEKKNFTHHNLINLLISFFPLSLILGNLAININVVLICLVGLIIYRFEVFKIKRKIYQYLIYIFFFYLILVTLITNIPLMVNFVPKIYPEAQFSKDLYEEHIVKSLFFLRFLLLFLVINKLVEEDHFKHNLFIISCSFFAFIVAFDILLQVSSGKNLLGYSISHYRPSSFFGDETIAGGYLQKFSLFAIISIISLSEKIKKNIYSIFLFSFFFIIIILTGNRMPAILFVFSVLVFFIFDKKIKEILLFLVLIIFFILTLFKFYSETRLIINMKTFYLSSSKIFTQIHDLNNYNKKIEEGSFKPDNNGYILLFNTGIHLWKDNKFFGNGLKSFKINCTYKPGQTCSTHPHNYTLEILLDTGVVGLATIYLIFILSTLDFIKFYKRGSNLKLLYLPFFLIILTEFFPIRSTGSFFTTNNASQIFFMLAITIAISNSKKN